jgi:putative CocE/NonD family hydrolase
LGHVRFGGNTVEWYTKHIEVPFFNYYLKGKGSVENIKEANIFFTGDNEWRQFPQWPPAATSEKSLYFHADGLLDWAQSPTAKSSFTEYISDPAKPVPYTEGIHSRRTVEYMTDDQRFTSTRPDVLVFQTDVLTKDVTLAGPVTPDLKVSISTTDADFVVKLIDVFPDNFSYGRDDDYIMGGYQMLVRGDIFRGRYRTSFEKPEPFVPGKVSEVKYTLPDVAHTFKKGHRIMVQVQSSWFPLADRNPQKFIDIYHAKDADFQKTAVRIWHDKINDSRIILPLLNN